MPIFAAETNLIPIITIMITDQDRELLAQKGISEAKLQQQLRQFAEGFPYLRLKGAAAVGQGILRPSDSEREAFLTAWDAYTATTGHRVVKFVPASGAASRMFKDLFAFLDADYDTPQTTFEKTFFDRLVDAPYYDALDDACHVFHGKGIAALLDEGDYKAVVSALLTEEGLNYGNLPKGLLQFHKYDDGVRTPVEEHLVEGALYAKGSDGRVSVHFTVSPQHRPLFEALISDKSEELAAQFGAQFDVSFSEQKASTDTVAANADNTPFRQADGSLLFRPGGHGALIENLNEIEADVIFIKNIDNVVPDRLKEPTVEGKKLIGGVLVSLQRQVFDYLARFDKGIVSEAELQEMLRFLEEKCCCHTDEQLTGDALAAYLRRKLCRPIRVCGMVKNVGEPGGGPFLAYNPDGTCSPQILESSQIDMSDPAKKAMFEQGTHFNPVDLVCAVRDYKGQPFNLPDYVDPQTGFISHKSKDGKELKALELPGLWNGAMSDWLTVFVEVPLITFNPVKTVNDLYREEHQ